MDFAKQLLERNGYVVSTNAMLSNATGSSTNAILLGNTLQSTGALFYVVPYVCKNKVSLQACLIALEAAQQHVTEYPSVAEDSGTLERTVTHMFTRVLNNLSRSIHVSDTQVALSLLNMNLEVSSDSFHFFGADNCVNYFKYKICQNEDEIATGKNPDNDLCNLERTLHVPDEIGITDDKTETFSDFPKFLNPEDNEENSDLADFGPAAFYKVKAKGANGETETVATPVQYPVHWWNRGEELKDLTAMEYYALVEVKPLKADKEGCNRIHLGGDDGPPSDDDADNNTPQKRGRKTSRPFRFHPTHPLYHSHAQYLRSKQPTLIFNAHPPKYPGTPPKQVAYDASPFEHDLYKDELLKWQMAADAFACYYSIVFLPQENFYGQHVPHKKPNWETFCEMIEKMEQRDLLIDRLRLRAMTTYFNALPSNYEKMTLLQNFRHRKSTKWSDQEKREAEQIFGASRKHKKFVDDDFQNILESTNSCQIFSSQKIKNALQELEYASQQMKTMEYLCPTPKPSDRTKPPTQEPVDPSADAIETSPDTILKYETNMGSATLQRSSEIQSARIAYQHGQQENQKIPSRKRTRDGTFLSVQTTVQNFLATRKLKLRQYQVVKKYADYFCMLHSHIEQNEGKVNFQTFHKKCRAPRCLLTGDPGTGKSYVIDTICQIVSLLGLGKVAASSYNGIAAVNIDGTTICSMFSINEKKSGRNTHLDSTIIEEMRLVLDIDKVVCLIIDEISTVDTRIIALLNFRMQQLLGIYDLPFGGVPVLFVGDFNQLGPVKKTFLPQDMLIWASRKGHLKPSTSSLQQPATTSLPTQQQKAQPDTSTYSIPQRATTKNIKATFAQFSTKFDTQQASFRRKIHESATRFLPGSLAHCGCSLLLEFQRHHLNEQVRSSSDPKHSAFVQKLSDGERISLTDILAYKHLSPSEIQNSPQWRFAPVLVSTNLERMNITRHKAKLWAIENKTYVFKWKNRTSNHVNKPSNLEDEDADYYDDNSFFWQFWVPGAPSYLTHNINGGLALVNGAPVKTHSLTFTDEENYTAILEWLSSDNAPPFGTEIEVPTPLSVNVEILPSLDGKPISTKRQQQLSELKKHSIFVPASTGLDGDSLDNNTNEHPLVIPITTTMVKNSTTKDTYMYQTYNPITPIATVDVRSPFPIDLGFAITIHKSQGRTMQRVVIDLNDHPNHYTRMEFAAVFVAMSRVTCSDNLRLLPRFRIGQRHNKDKAYAYLCNLRPNRFSAAFYHGFIPDESARDDAMIWNPTLALQYTQN